jgi:hypothetical protein
MKVKRNVFAVIGWVAWDLAGMLGVKYARRGRVLRLGYFASQPPNLLIALCGRSGARVDLLTVPPGTPREIAETAMATAGNQVHAHDILTGTTTTHHRDSPQASPEDTWETEDGRLAQDPTSSSRPGRPHGE